MRLKSYVLLDKFKVLDERIVKEDEARSHLERNTFQSGKLSSDSGLSRKMQRRPRPGLGGSRLLKGRLDKTRREGGFTRELRPPGHGHYLNSGSDGTAH
jgi:hypothetical protein